MGRFFGNSRGVALILTILIVSLIVALTLQFNRTMRTHVASAGNIGHGLKALYVAKSGITFALAMLKADDDDPKVDSVLDDWADPENLARITSAVLQELSGGGHFELKIEDLSGKIPINQLVLADKEIVKREIAKIFERFLNLEDFGLEDEKVDTIVDSVKDWVDNNDLNSDEFRESEDDYYMSLEKPYHCKDGPLDALEELRLVRGMKPEEMAPELFSSIVQHISVFGDEKININTADPLVLSSLHDDLTLDMAKDMADYRANSGEDTLTSSTWYYNEGAGVPESIKLPKETVATTSKHFKITSVGHFGNMTKRVEAAAERDPDKGKIRILSWKID
jgi:general secretion pathway protein K